MKDTQGLEEGKARWERGQELYKAGAVKIGADGYFHVNGFKVDTDTIRCECKDFTFRKKACKHIYASIAYQKARQNGNGNGSTPKDNGKGNGNGNGANGKEPMDWITEISNMPSSYDKPQPGIKEPSDKAKQGPGKALDRQATITRLAVLNTATEVLKTHRKPIELTEILSLASELEAWALGRSN